MPDEEPDYSNPGFEDIDPDGCTPEQIVAMLPKVHKLILEVLDTYMVLDPETRAVIAAWILSVPYYKSFTAFPYLFINASKGSGKTRLLTLIKEMLPNSIIAATLSESALFRSRKDKLCILIDEAEHLHGREKENLRDLLNQGYKRGGVAMRTGKDKKGNYRVDEFPVYGPIAMANIWGLDSVLESKCLTVVLQKSDDPTITRRPLMLDWDPRIKAIKHYGDDNWVYVGRFLEDTLNGVIISYFYKYINIYLPTPSTPTYTNIEDHPFIKLVSVMHANGRDFELWLPLLEITYTASPSIALELVDIISKKAQERQEDEAETDRDANLAVRLYEYLHTLDSQTAWFSLKDFLNWMGPDVPEGMRPETLARIIRRLGVKKEQKRTKRGNEYTLDPQALKRYLKVRGLLTNYAVQGQGEARQSPPPELKPQKMLETQPQAASARPQAVSEQGKPQEYAQNTHRTQDSVEVEGRPTSQIIIDLVRSGAILGTEAGKWDLLYNLLPNVPRTAIDRIMTDMWKITGEIREMAPGQWKLTNGD